MVKDTSFTDVSRFAFTHLSRGRVSEIRSTYHFVMLNACEASPDSGNKREILRLRSGWQRKMTTVNEFSDGLGWRLVVPWMICIPFVNDLYTLWKMAVKAIFHKNCFIINGLQSGESVKGVWREFYFADILCIDKVLIFTMPFNEINQSGFERS